LPIDLEDSRQNNLVDAIARGENMEPLLSRLQTEENRKKELIAELDLLTRPTQVVELDKMPLKRDLRTRVADAKSLLGRQTSQARKILRKLLGKPLIYEVINQNGTQGLRITGEGSYLHLLNSGASPCVVSPTGFEPVLLP
jgi:hypothetical protein